MEIKKNFARNIDSKTKKSTIIGIMATYSGNVVPNTVTRCLSLKYVDSCQAS